MRLWTWKEIKDKVLVDLDLQGEEIVSPSELLGYVNEAIDEAEANIHNLAEDYFLTREYITMVPDQSLYALPDDIYGHKVRSLQFNNGAERYAIHRMKSFDAISFVNPSESYRWLLTNKINTGLNSNYGPKLELFPAARESGNFITCYYLRNARRLVLDTDECDVPEFVSFIVAFIKVKCCVKELHPRLDFFQAELARVREQMTTTLSEMVPDGDNDIEPDMSAYIEHV